MRGSLALEHPVQNFLVLVESLKGIEDVGGFAKKPIDWGLGVAGICLAVH